MAKKKAMSVTPMAFQVPYTVGLSVPEDDGRHVCTKAKEAESQQVSLK